MTLNAEAYTAIEGHIEKYVKEHLAQWLEDMSHARPVPVYEIELRERLIRVEEELRHQRDILLKFMEQVDRRFEQVEKRFEQVDRRFEQMDKRFESLTRRIDRFMIWSFSITISVGGLVVAAIKLLP